MMLMKWQPRVASRWSPSADTRSLFRSWDSMLEEFFRPTPLSPAERADWVPRIDVTEEKDRYVVDVDLPGLEKKDVEVTMEDGVLTISGERKFDRNEENETLHRRERFVGRFSRSMTFPSDVDTEKVEAGFKNGVLRVALAKTEQAKPRAIEIQ